MGRSRARIIAAVVVALVLVGGGIAVATAGWPLGCERAVTTMVRDVKDLEGEALQWSPAYDDFNRAVCGADFFTDVSSEEVVDRYRTALQGSPWTARVLTAEEAATLSGCAGDPNDPSAAPAGECLTYSYLKATRSPFCLTVTAESSPGFSDTTHVYLISGKCSELRVYGA